jgi:hypothetical protein
MSSTGMEDSGLDFMHTCVMMRCLVAYSVPLQRPPVQDRPEFLEYSREGIPEPPIVSPLSPGVDHCSEPELRSDTVSASKNSLNSDITCLF